MPSLSMPASNAPGVLGSAATRATQTGSWLNTGAAAITSISDAMAGAYQSRVAFNNAALAKQDSEAAIAAGRYGAERELLATGQQVGREKAAQAANNLDVNKGSPAQVRAATEALGTLDAATIMYNAKRNAAARAAEASSYRAQGNLMAAATGFNALRDIGKTYNSFIAGSTALTDQALSFGQVGVGT